MKKQVILLLFMCLCVNVSADNFLFGGLYYNTLSENTVEVGYNSGYSKLEVVIPEEVAYNGKTFKVTQLGSGAFQSSKLRTITLPASITYIDQAFNGTPITTIIFNSATPPEVYAYAHGQLNYTIPVLFAGISSKPKCYIPCGSLEAYLTSDWRNITDMFFEQVLHEVNLEVSNKSHGVAKVLSKTDCQNWVISAIPNEGFVFVKWSDGNTQATRYLEVTEDISLTAYFAKEGYTIHVYQDCNTTIE